MRMHEGEGSMIATTRNARRPVTLNRAGLSDAARRLAERDRDLRRILETHGPPPLWGRRPGFTTLVQIILEQQVSLSSGRAAYRRLARAVVPFTPRRFIELGAATLRSAGLTRQKAAYCVHLAEEVSAGRLDLRAIARLDDAAVASALTRVKGVGPWTANVYLLMALRRPDIWPAGDIALIQAVRRVKGLRRRPSPERAARIADAWRPFRSVAARMMWQHYLAERARATIGSR
jgi:DNA-3-methyladenine glycosylase II